MRFVHFCCGSISLQQASPNAVVSQYVIESLMLRYIDGDINISFCVEVPKK